MCVVCVRTRSTRKTTGSQRVRRAPLPPPRADNPLSSVAAFLGNGGGGGSAKNHADDSISKTVPRVPSANRDGTARNSRGKRVLGIMVFFLFFQFHLYTIIFPCWMTVNYFSLLKFKTRIQTERFGRVFS